MSHAPSARALVRAALVLSLGLVLIPSLRPGKKGSSAESSSPEPSQLSRPETLRDSGSAGDRQPSGSVSEPAEFPSSNLTAGAENVEGGDQELDVDVDRIDPGEVQRMLAGMEDVVTDAQRQLKYQLLAHWAGTSPMEAATWSRGHLKGKDQSEADTVIATRWFESDPASAMAFAKSMEDPEGRGTALLTLGYEALRESPRQAMELVQEVPPSDSRNDFLIQAVQEWSGQEFETVKSWVERFDEPSLKQRLRSAAAIGMAEGDGRTAAVYAATTMEPGEDQNRAVVSVLQRWVQTQPQAAVSWLEQFPESDLKRVATQNLFPVWFQQDPENATQWLNGLPQGSLRRWAQDARSSVAGIPIP